MDDFDFNLDINIGLEEKPINKRYIQPKKIKSLKNRMIKYSNAEKLASDILIEKGDRFYTFVSGNFIFGDFIEAYVVQKNLHLKSMTISTLSMNENNIDSLANLLNGDYSDKLNLIVSDYFYENEKFKMIPYLLDKLDVDNKLQLAVCRSHTKICIFETYDGMKFSIHGSANLRSSDNIEQFCIEECEELYDFNKSFHDEIIKQYKLINKKVGGKKLWQILEKVDHQGKGNRTQQENETLNEHKF